MRKRERLELVMGLILLAAAYLLSRESARLVSLQGGSALVVLDPGHGGDDPGKIGINGAKEKELNLEIAKRVRKRLEQAGVSVLLTREDDGGLYDSGAPNKKVQDLQRRVQFIHDRQPDCVVSIHQNSYPEPEVKGAQVFYYEHSAEGERLAGALQDSLNACLGPERPRQEKGNTTYYMLKRTDAVLVICECGFLSNPEEAELLTREEYQEKVAEAVCSGVLAYLGNAEEKSGVQRGANEEKTDGGIRPDADLPAGRGRLRAGWPG